MLRISSGSNARCVEKSATGMLNVFQMTIGKSHSQRVPVFQRIAQSLGAMSLLLGPRVHVQSGNRVFDQILATPQQADDIFADGVPVNGGDGEKTDRSESSDAGVVHRDRQIETELAAKQDYRTIHTRSRERIVLPTAPTHMPDMEFCASIDVGIALKQPERK